MAKTAKAKSTKGKKRQPPSYVPMGAQDPEVIRLNEFVEGSQTRRLKDEAQALYDEIYPPKLPRPGIGKFIAAMVARGIDAVRADRAAVAP